MSVSAVQISIHALLAESDSDDLGDRLANYCISIHALLAESDVVRVCEFVWGVSISIHALLAESDTNIFGGVYSCIAYFYPRSPCGERPIPETLVPRQNQFLSTLSLRRATNSRTDNVKRNEISIHALLAESDTWVLQS